MAFVIGKYTETFLGGRGIPTVDIFCGEGIVQGLNSPGGNFTLMKFARSPIQNCFYLIYFLFVLLTFMLQGIVRGKFSPGWNCLEFLSIEGGGSREKLSIGEFSMR